MAETEHTEIKWEKDNGTLEIRTQGTLADGRPALDEIVATGANVHLEQMDHDRWWIGLDAVENSFHLKFGIEDGRLCAYLSDQDDDNGEWEGDNRERPLALTAFDTIAGLGRGDELDRAFAGFKYATAAG